MFSTCSDSGSSTFKSGRSLFQIMNIIIKLREGVGIHCNSSLPFKKTPYSYTPTQYTQTQLTYML